MKRNSNTSHGKSKRVGSLSKKKITKLSQECGFEKRKGKMKASDMIMAFMLMMREGSSSYWSWARCLTRVIGKKISKQAIFCRMTTAWVKLVKVLLEEAMLQQSMKQVKGKLFKNFGQVLLQDSTTLHLPDVLYSRFKGNVSGGEQKSVAKINTIFNVLTGICPVMNIVSYTVSEQQLGASILSVAQPGDLVIRDLGYFVLDAFRKMEETGIYFLSRLRYGVGLYDAVNGEKINLIRLLKGKTYIDQVVICGNTVKGEKPLKVRIVAMKLSAPQAAERKRKAKADRDRRLNHSEQYYELLGYVIFITNVSVEVWNYQQVAAAYRVRWNIEILFKSWKSGFKIEEMLPSAKTKTERVESILYLMLIYIAWFQLLVMVPLRWMLKEQKQGWISIIQMVKYVLSDLHKWMTEDISRSDLKTLAYFCKYDKRLDRLDAATFLEQFYIP
jgi:hypothetical protein